MVRISTGNFRNGNGLSSGPSSSSIRLSERIARLDRESYRHGQDSGWWRLRVSRFSAKTVVGATAI